MSKVLSGARTFTSVTDRFTFPFGGMIPIEATERPITMRIAGTASRLAASVDNVGSTRLYTIRKNGANGNNTVNLGSTTQTTVYDTTHTDHYDVGDTFCGNWDNVSGTTQVFWCGFTFEADDGSGVAFYSPGELDVTGTVFLPLTGRVIGGARATATESNAQVKMRTNGTIISAAVLVAGSASNAQTWRIRNNGSNGNISISVPASTSGTFEDTTHTDDFFNGDLVCWTETGCNTIGSAHFVPVAVIRWANGQSEYISWCGTNSTSWTPLVVSGTYASTETVTKRQHGFDGSLSKLRYQALQNSGGTTTIRLRKNGANGNQVVTIPSGNTGWFEDTTNTDSFVAADDLNYQLSASATQYALIAITFTPAVQTFQVTAKLALTGSQILNENVIGFLTPQFDISSTLDVDAFVGFSTGSGFSISSSLSVTNTKILWGAFAKLDATCSISITALQRWQSTAELDISSDWSTDTRQTWQGSAGIAADSNILVNTIQLQQIFATVVIAASSDVSAVGTTKQLVTCVIPANADCIFNASRYTKALASLTATSSLSAKAKQNFVTSGLLACNSPLSAVSSITYCARAILPLSSSWSNDVGQVFGYTGEADLRPNSSLTVNAHVLVEAKATFYCSSNLTVNALRFLYLNETLPVYIKIDVATTVRTPLQTSVAWSLVSTLSVSNTTIFTPLQASSVWNLNSSLTVNFKYLRSAIALLSGDTTLSVDSVVRDRNIYASLFPDSALSVNLVFQRMIKSRYSLSSDLSLPVTSMIWGPRSIINIPFAVKVSTLQKMLESSTINMSSDCIAKPSVFKLAYQSEIDIGSKLKVDTKVFRVEHLYEGHYRLFGNTKGVIKKKTGSGGLVPAKTLRGGNRVKHPYHDTEDGP